MKHTISSSLFSENRKRLAIQLKPSSIAVCHSNDTMPTSADGTMRFVQNTDLFYLTGIHQEETILLLFPDAREARYKEVLFLRETSELIATWEGKKLTKEEARTISGIQTIYWTSEFLSIFRQLVFDSDHIYLNTNEHRRAIVEVETRDARFVTYCKEQYPLHSYHRLAPFMHRLRAIKSAEEIRLMQQACDLTEKGFRRALKFIKPGVNEREIVAEYAHEFIRHHGDFADYQPIIASGANACVLHYHDNDQVCQDGDLVLMDVGAGYCYYNADMTRVVPVNGRFSKRQKEVYNAVLRVMKTITQAMIPGKYWKDLQLETEKCVEKELVDLGLLSLDAIKKQDGQTPAFKKYFMHGVAHFLGLNVHDVGFFHEPLQAGTVLTCEPGIYIKEEGIGIRLENNILITEKGPLDLMKHIPIEPDEIEDIMNRK